jgi:hypothetical protein
MVEKLWYVLDRVTGITPNIPGFKRAEIITLIILDSSIARNVSISIEDEV